MLDDLPIKEGLRARKRRETFRRIADAGLDLFLAKSYQATTLDEIALAAGISRRTFFYYFRSKDDILLAHMNGYVNALRELVLEHSAAGAPFDIACAALKALAASSEPSRAIAIARVMNESEALRARAAFSYQQFELALYEGLCAVCPDEDRSDGLRLVAMTASGVMRLAADAWRQDDGKESLAKYIENGFSSLKAELDAHLIAGRAARQGSQAI
ncbi:TetR family transcriptional regulator [Brucella endophytica]|uniref:TetR family transcriptional regulator n=1 Tax=Brucella endophytica TaxID=1963359 RepID=A0A916S3Y1_9HYPH|nr:TetR/AcrR family transcriptional regulator [Brucella endophytica]GGA83262.1 TetR family transcriptional regulator [Brucella endophytica]